MKRKLPVLLSVYLGMATVAFSQGTLQITFDGPPALRPNSGIIVTNYNEAGMSFTSLPQSGFFIRNNSANSLYPYDGSAYIQGEPPVQFSFKNGSLFSLVSVDLAEYSTVVPDAVTTSFTTDGIIDGTGPLADFQTFNFTGFNDLTRVEIPTFGWSLDNLVVSVPEPASCEMLILSGGLALAWRSGK